MWFKKFGDVYNGRGQGIIAIPSSYEIVDNKWVVIIFSDGSVKEHLIGSTYAGEKTKRKYVESGKYSKKGKN